MSEPHYHINLTWSDEDSCWIASAPDLRFCMTHGNTRAEALANMEEAIEGHLAVMRDEGLPIPEPTYRSPLDWAKAA